MLHYAPDQDPATKDVLLEMDGFIPSISGGYEAMPGAGSTGLPALSAACTGAALLIDLSGVSFFLAGTTDKLFSAAATTWTDVSRAGNYSSGSVWRFAQFGNVSLATNYVDVLQFATGGAFANIGAGVPKAKFITTAAANFVLIANTTEATFGVSTNRWWCSGIGDYADWTPAVSTQCTTGLLVDTPGALTGFGKLGDWPLLFKERALYVGRYVGTPVVWEWTLTSDSVGAPTQEAIVNIGPAVLFLGHNDFYAFDGTQPIPIGEGIRDWFFVNRSAAFRGTMASGYDFVNQRVFWFYVKAGSSAIDSWVCYDLRTKRWGAGTLALEAVASFQSGAITYATIGDFFASYAATIPAYDSLFWNQGTILPAFFDATHTLKGFTAPAGTATFTTGDLGDELYRSFVRRVTPRYLVNPTSATLTPYTRMRQGDALTAQSTVTQDSRKRFDFRQSARWHRYKLATVGDVEIVGLVTDAKQEGTE